MESYRREDLDCSQRLVNQDIEEEFGSGKNALSELNNTAPVKPTLPTNKRLAPLKVTSPAGRESKAQASLGGRRQEEKSRQLEIGNLTMANNSLEDLAQADESLASPALPTRQRHTGMGLISENQGSRNRIDISGEQRTEIPTTFSKQPKPKFASLQSVRAQR